MASTPWKVHDRDGELRAAVKHAEDAAALVAVLGDETTIRRNNLIVWHEGHEKQPASESYDFVASMAHSRHEGYVVRDLGLRGVPVACPVCGGVEAGHTCCPPDVPVGRKYVLRTPKRTCNDCGKPGELRYVCVGVGAYVDLCRDCELERQAAEVRR